SFARRGLELEEMLRRIRLRCERARVERLNMVWMRLRQWTRVATGPADPEVFAASIEPLWSLTKAEAPGWSLSPATRSRRLAAARDLVAALERFNRRWTEFLGSFNLQPANLVIDQYNRYYVMEKECVMGSGRLAARFFTPVPPLTSAQLLLEHPLLPIPELIEQPRGWLTG
ncbi:MAG: hypothetical protein ACYC61_12250, partial [Isosphaeraceae bacterium]